MFRGQWVHNIDAKGRVSMPARFREALGGSGEECVEPKFVITPAPFDPCLHLFALSEWEKVEESVNQLPLMSPDAVRLRRVYVSAAMECELDRSGRVLVPGHLRDKAGFDREVLWAGMGRMVELWAKNRWDAVLTQTPAEEVAFRAAVEKIL